MGGVVFSSVLFLVPKVMMLDDLSTDRLVVLVGFRMGVTGLVLYVWTVDNWGHIGRSHH